MTTSVSITSAPESPAAPATGSSGCCSSGELAICCAPEAKGACCGIPAAQEGEVAEPSAAPSSCGCR